MSVHKGFEQGFFEKPFANSMNVAISANDFVDKLRCYRDSKL